jgi:hypothetical protein
MKKPSSNQRRARKRASSGGSVLSGGLVHTHGSEEAPESHTTADQPEIRRAVKVTVVFSADTYESVMKEVTHRKITGLSKATISGVVDDAILRLTRHSLADEPPV